MRPIGRSASRILALLGLSLLAIGPARAADDLAAAGIRRIDSKHLTLLTDVPANAEVDALPEYFDQAFPQWCAYFGVDAAKHADWHERAYLMISRERFEKAGLVSPELPKFLHGYARGDQIWLNEQTSTYYRRHLLLHEGTHAFMDTLVAGWGPPWFSEGMAELLATHAIVDGRVQLDYFPKTRDEVPKWGRVEFVQQEVGEHRPRSFESLPAYTGDSFFQGEPYGWCWAAAAFLENNPRYRERFHKLPKQAKSRSFNADFKREFADGWERLQEDWQIYAANLDYGYDFERMDVNYGDGKPMQGQSASVSVAADRGWQSSGVQVEAGRKYTISASGRYQIGTDPRVWWCEPGGVTLRYYRGQPLGILLAAVRSDKANPQGKSGLLTPVVVGSGTTIAPTESGTLYFRINDAPGSLADNAGTLEATITRE